MPKIPIYKFGHEPINKPVISTLLHGATDTYILELDARIWRAE